MSRNDMPAETLRRLLEYSPDTGQLRWSMDPENKAKAGRNVGTVAANGYVMVRLCGKLRLAHRLAWTMHYGRPPTHNIDHINRNRGDNRLCNLRDVPHSANMRNNPHRPLLVGAVATEGGQWSANVHRYGTVESVGTFDHPDDANAAWQKARAVVDKPDAPRPRVRVPQLSR